MGPIRRRAIVLVADSFGIGSTPDADRFGDTGANTFAHITHQYRLVNDRLLSLPNLGSMGLTQAALLCSDEALYVDPIEATGGAYGAAAELSSGKDTPSGHWEMMGVPVMFDWGYYPDTPECFPAEFLQALCERTGVSGVLGRCHASGTDIIRELGEEHVRTGQPICYTSADSVFQVAAHEEAFGLDRLYEFCETAREMLFDDNIGRVIARPFVGDDAGSFTRTGNRRDYSVAPPEPTLLDYLVDNGKTVSAIGKISDIFAHQGISKSTKATGLPALLDSTIEDIQTAEDGTLIFTNLVNFDQDFGHRRDPIGYAEALVYFDQRLDDVKAAMEDDDLLIITADHGCDPTWPGSDHTREYVPVLVWRRGMAATALGKRDSFADIGQTLADYFQIPALSKGQSFSSMLV